VLFQSAEAAFEKLDQPVRESCPRVVKRILIIDDDDDFRRMLRFMLEASGYEVVEASDGEAGISCQSEHMADLIISDMVMPRREGIETVLTIKEKYPDVMTILMSGFDWYGHEAEMDVARAMGAGVLKKPFNREELLSAIEALCCSPAAD